MQAKFEGCPVPCVDFLTRTFDGDDVFVWFFKFTLSVIEETFYNCTKYSQIQDNNLFDI